MSIAEKLKNVPPGFKLYSSICGECELGRISDDEDCITVIDKFGSEFYFTFYGIYITSEDYESAECLLFPSKEVRDWSNFSLKEIEKCNFKPFDKVIVRDDDADIWKCNFFSHITTYKDEKDNSYDMYQCLDEAYCQCLPYNKETAKLIGTTDNYE